MCLCGWLWVFLLCIDTTQPFSCLNDSQISVKLLNKQQQQKTSLNVKGMKINEKAANIQSLTA